VSAYREGTRTGKLRDLGGTLRRRWRVVAALALLGAALAGVRSFQQIPIFEATASVLVRPLGASPIQTGQRPNQVLDMAGEKQIMRSHAVAAIAARRMRVTAAPSELLGHVSADVEASSQIIHVHFRYVEPATAQRGANAFAEAFLAFRQENVVREVRNSRSSLQRQIAALAAKKSRQDAIASPDSNARLDQRRAALELSDSYSKQIADLEQRLAALGQLDLSPGEVIEPADLPTSPAGPGPLRSVAVGLLVGGLAGIVVAFVRDRTDSRLRGRRDLAERLDRPVLGQIPEFGRWRRRRSGLVVLEEPDSPAAEAYRAVRARLTRVLDRRGLGSIMVVSPGSDEGKSTIAANLAVALAESGRSVLLVSADLRRPRLHELFGLPNRSGLSNLLTEDLLAAAETSPPVVDGKRRVAELWSVAPNLWVVLSGPLPPQSSALLDSTAMRQFLEEQQGLFDLVLLDCPPALVPDSLALASLVDGVLVVADAKRTQRSAVDRLRDELGQPDDKLIGAVLNRATGAEKRSYYYADQ
jgi:succinoglycan biosynthesis transport protein ExoP